jgi:hypothetical protein
MSPGRALSKRDATRASIRIMKVTAATPNARLLCATLAIPWAWSTAEWPVKMAACMAV